ncbi:hypothetical protein B0187_06020 [Haemophilus paracuniculus]|uniref:Uncharacterized protein n=1 Tax=Haemophilus paracuniculus TaxID=734 RepID=A0A1T0ASP7_9PAST|nr:hypothetical protein [Haemophilus paracuniculus]OOR99311.1 hypothetical protein B0187_06020 [Haemophilus paracuniculus]
MIYELKTELRYKLRIAMASFWDDDDFEVSINVTPDFDGYNRNVDDDCVVIDFDLLFTSLNREMEAYFLTCECGVSEDVGIDAPITSKILNDTIIWDIPIEDYGDILAKPYSNYSEGILRLIFDKTQYTQATFQLIRELKLLAKEGIKTAGLTEQDFTCSYGMADWFLPKLATKYAHITHLPIKTFNPYDCSSLDFIEKYPVD